MRRVLLCATSFVRRVIGVPVRRAPMMVPALKLAAFTFTSISDAI